MKQLYRVFTSALLAILFFSAFNGSAQSSFAYEVRVVPTYVQANSSVTLRFEMRNKLQATVFALGQSAFTVNLNPSQLFIGGATITSSGQFSAPSQGYDALTVTSNGNQLSLNVNVTNPPNGSGTALPPDDIFKLVGEVSVPITDCFDPLVASGNTASTVLSSYPNNPISSSLGAYFFGIASIDLKPPLVGTPTTVISNPTPNGRYCNTGSISVNVIGGSYASYQFFRKSGPFSVGTPISGVLQPAQLPFAFTPTATTPQVQDGDIIYAVVLVSGVCRYKLPGVQVFLDQLNAKPVLVSSTSPLCANAGVGGPIRVYTVTKDVNSSSVWSILPTNAGTISQVVNTATTSSNTITFSSSYSGYATITVALTNACGPGDSYSFLQRIDAAVPAKPNPPTLANNVVGVPCINDTAIQRWQSLPYPAGHFVYEYAISPKEAINPTFGGIGTQLIPKSDGSSDSSQVRIFLNRNYTDSIFYLKVRSRNGCGFSPWDSTLYTIRRLPPKPTKPVFVEALSLGNDTICQGTDSSTFTSTIPIDTAVQSTKGYQFFVTVDGQKNTPGGGALTYVSGAVPFTYSVDSLIRNTPKITIKWNKKFYGYVRITMAAISKGCKTGLPYYFASGLGIANPSGLGDTSQYLSFFVKPKPLRPTKPVGDRGYCNSIPHASDTFRTVMPKYGKTLSYFFRDASNNITTAIGVFDSAAYKTQRAKFNWVNNGVNVPNGTYYLFAYSTNECGNGDTSVRLRIRISSAAPTGTADILPGSFRGPLPYLESKKYSLCQSAAVQTVIYNSDATDYAYFKWKVETVFLLNGVGPTVVAPVAGQGGAYPDIDSTSIQVTYPANFAGTVKITATPINICDTNTVTNPLSKFFYVKVYRNPQIYAGVPGSGLPAGALYTLGGGAAIGNGVNLPPTAQGSTPPYNYFWTVLPTSPGLVIADTNASNPIITLPPGITGPVTYSVSLTARDSNYCRTVSPAPLATTISSLPASNISFLASLQGATTATQGTMSTGLFSNTGTPNVLNRSFKKNDIGDVNAGLMAAGFAPKAEGSVVPVDQVIVEARADTNTPTLASGYGWLMSDGTVRDFENQLSPFVRLTSLTPISTNSVYIVLKHRNHLSVISKVPYASTSGITPPSSVYNFTTPANIYKAATSAFVLNGFSSLVAGDAANASVIDQQYPEVNSADGYVILTKLLQNPVSLTNVYGQEDANLDGQITPADFAITDLNNNSVYFSSVP